MRALLVIALLIGFATPQQDPRIAEALRLQARDPAGAAKILEGVAERSPDDARVWRLLGIARQQAKQLDAALEAYAKSVAIRPDPVATYNIAVVHALKGQTDQAFEWLQRAKTARADMSVLEVDPNLKGLRGDKRFKSLMPTRADFADPFVEKTTILHEWMGEASNDQYGWVARAIGDVDKDGVDDFVTCAPGHASGAGRLYVYSTKTRKLLWSADGNEGDRLGVTVEAAGDTNKDGIPDVVATGGGRVKVYSGKDGAVLRTISSPGSMPLLSVAGAGDTNADGYSDIIAGSNPPPPTGAAAAAPAPPATPGMVYVFSGKDGSVLLTLTGERNGDTFGSAVAGDVRGGSVLLMVGAPGAGPNQSGRAYVYTSLSTRPAFVIDADESGTALGAMFVAAAGDVDGDGRTDAYVSDFVNRAKGPSTGRIYVHSGKDGRRILELTGETVGEAFGTSASHAGDIDGDGRADLAIGAWQYAGAAISGGRIYVYSGKDGRLLRTITGRIPGDTLGFDSVGIGDTDDDGTIDLLVTSAYSGVNGYRSGRVFIVSSGGTRR